MGVCPVVVLAVVVVCAGAVEVVVGAVPVPVPPVPVPVYVVAVVTELGCLRCSASSFSLAVIWSAWTMKSCQMIAGKVPPSTGAPL